MSVIGKKPYIEKVIEELSEGGEMGKEMLERLSTLVNNVPENVQAYLDLHNPYNKFNYLPGEFECAYASIKLDEGLVRKGFFIVGSKYITLIAFNEYEENMECYDLTWSKYNRSYRIINESLDINEFRRLLLCKCGPGDKKTSEGMKQFNVFFRFSDETGWKGFDIQGNVFAQVEDVENLIPANTLELFNKYTPVESNAEFSDVFMGAWVAYYDDDTGEGFSGKVINLSLTFRNFRPQELYFDCTYIDDVDQKIVKVERQKITGYELDISEIKQISIEE